MSALYRRPDTAWLSRGPLEMLRQRHSEHHFQFYLTKRPSLYGRLLIGASLYVFTWSHTRTTACAQSLITSAGRLPGTNGCFRLSRGCCQEFVLAQGRSAFTARAYPTASQTGVTFMADTAIGLRNVSAYEMGCGWAATIGEQTV